MFQPLPDPVSSSGASDPFTAAVWLIPVSVVLGNAIDDGGVRPRLPPVHVIVYATIVPELPAAQQWFVSVQLTSLSVFVVPDAWLAQVVPPFVVVSMGPVAPPAQQWVVSGHATSFRLLLTPETCADHSVPPFAVVRIVPVAPTVQHELVLGQATSDSELAEPDVWPLQLVPPFVVARI